MIDTYTDAFDSMWESIPTARIEVRAGQHVYSKALCSGIQLNSQTTEQGMTKEATCVVRLKVSDEDERNPLPENKKVELKQYDEENWSTYRIDQRRRSGGILTLTMVTPYE
jgi:hypothetical protein